MAAMLPKMAATLPNMAAPVPEGLRLRELLAVAGNSVCADCKAAGQ